MLVKVEPSARLLNVPKIGLAKVLLITVKIVPTVNVPVPVSTKVNGTLLLMVTPRAETSDALALVRMNKDEKLELALRYLTVSVALLLVTLPALLLTVTAKRAPLSARVVAGYGDSSG